jgi:hypothetical protein
MLSRRTLAMTRRWATVLLTIAAWILLSNHCAFGLGGTAVSSDSETDGCPMHSAPAKEKPVTNIPCCKELRAVASHAMKSVSAVARQLAGTQDYVAAVFVVPPRLAFQPASLDTGPPRARLSFAEAVLQRSVLAHAPPSVFDRV